MSVNISAPFAIAMLLAFARSMAWISSAPLFSNVAIPTKIKIGVAIALAFLAAGQLEQFPLPQSDGQLMIDLVIQAGIGFALGFIVNIFVSAVVSAGSLIDLFSGLNLPQAIDPLSQQQTAIFGQFYNLLLTALLFTSGAAIIIVDGFLRSYKAVGTTFPSVTVGSLASVITRDVTTFFVSAVEIAAPVIVVLFLTQVLLALLAKAVPQINVFIFGMPIQVGIALLSVSIAIKVIPNDISNLVARGVTQIFGGG